MNKRVAHQHTRSISEQLKQRKMDMETESKDKDKSDFKIEAMAAETPSAQNE